VKINYYVGTLKGIGRIYQQTAIDTYSRVATAKLYTQKNALVAADLLNDRVLPFFEEHDLPVLRMLTDRGSEYCGHLEHHAYQLYLAVEDIDHSRTKAYHPQTNGICERFHKTIKTEFYDLAFRKKLYRTLDELQLDVDEWLVDYNTRWAHSGRYCYGKTPMQTFLDSKHLAQDKQLERLHHPVVPATVSEPPLLAGIGAAHSVDSQGRSEAQSDRRERPLTGHAADFTLAQTVAALRAFGQSPLNGQSSLE
jgi:hypothetical protein